MKVRTRSEFRNRRHLRVRAKVKGTAARPRFCVFVSNRHLYVQFVDDDAGCTLASTSTMSPDVAVGKKGSTVEVAKKLGTLAAQAARAKGIEAVVFDRGGFAYRGRVKALAEAAREAGLKF